MYQYSELEQRQELEEILSSRSKKRNNYILVSDFKFPILDDKVPFKRLEYRKLEKSNTRRKKETVNSGKKGKAHN